jgi:hypothetical protein
MEISKIVRKVLLEQETINWDNTYDLVNNYMQFCDTNKSFAGKKIKFLSKTSELGQNIKTFNKFPALVKSGKDNVAFVGNGNIVVFGLKNPFSKNNSLLAYNITSGTPQRIEGGAGSQCNYFKKMEDVGQVTLSAMDYGKVKSWAKRKGVVEFEMNKPEDILNYREVKLSTLKDEDGKPLLSNPGDGSIWYQVASGEVSMGNIPEELKTYMENQGFTQNKPPIGSDVANFSFYFKDIQKDLPAFSLSQDLRDTLIYFPEETSEAMNPSREQCRDVIQKLDMCRTVGFQGDDKVKRKFGSSCSTDLFKNKFMSLRCQSRKFIGGAFGNKDEFERLLNDRTSPFGLGNLKSKLGKAQYSKVTENIDLKINKLLNEEFKKFSFSKKSNSNIDNIVNSIFENVTNDLSKYKKTIKEDDNFLSTALGGIKNIGSSLFSNPAEKLTQAFKERIGKFIVGKIGSFIGYPNIQNSYVGLAIVNVFANTDIKDMKRLFNDCDFSSPIITKSLLEAYLDKMAVDHGIDSFVYSAIKNMVTESAAESSAFKALQDKVAQMICPILEGLSDMVLSKLGIKK